VLRQSQLRAIFLFFLNTSHSMDTGDLNLPAHKYQLEQVELALKAQPDDAELLKLKQDLEEVIQLTAELLGCDPGILNLDDPTATLADAGTNAATSSSSTYSAGPQLNNAVGSSSARAAIKWKTGDRCLAPWNEDGKYYECTIDDVLDDGTCTIVYDGFESAPLTVVRVSKLKPFDRTRSIMSGPRSAANRAKTKRELEQRLRELKRRKREKKSAKLKEFEEEREKDKKRWTDFNSKLTGRTWKGVVSKSMVKTDKKNEQLRGTTVGFLAGNKAPQPRP
jgi:survival-of-motor-neuron-related-splicing factor 30